MSKKNRKAKSRKQTVIKPQNTINSVASTSVASKSVSGPSTVVASGRGLIPIKHKHIAPDLIRIGIIAGIIFAIEIILSFIIH